MNNAFESILMDALDALADGESLEAILARYPAEADELRPMLETVAALNDLRIAPDQAAQAASRRAFLAEAEQMKAAPLAGRSPWLIFRRVLTTAAGLALVLLVLGGVLVVASASTLPGDALYPLQVAVDQIRVSMADDPAGVRADLAEKRMAQLEEMLATGREGQLELLGIVEELDADTLVLNGLELNIAGVPGADTVVVGDEVVILVEVTDGEIHVLEITLLVPGDFPLVVTPPPEDTPTNTPPRDTDTPTPVPVTATPSPTTTPSPTSTATGTATTTSTSTGTATPTKTITPTPTSTPEPTDDDDYDDTPEPGETDTPEPWETETPEPEDTDTPEPGETDTPEPGETDTPEPGETETPEPTDDNSGPGGGDDTPEPTEDSGDAVGDDSTPVP